MADRYWVGGTGSWSDTARWSTSSGGAGGASVPTASDNAILNGSSGGGTATVDAGADRVCLSLTTTGYTGTMSMNNELNIYGNLTIGSSTSFTSGGALIMAAASGSATITTNGVTIPELQLGSTLTGSCTATFTLQDNLTVNGLTGIVELVFDAIFDANDFNLNIERLRNAGGGRPTVRMGNGTWTLSGTGSLLDDLSADMIVREGANIVVSDTSSTAKNYELNGNHIPQITLPSSTAVHSFIGSSSGAGGSGSIDVIVAPAGTVIKFEELAVFSIGSIAANGTANSHVSISSTTNGQQHTLRSLNGEAFNLDYLTIQDSIVDENIRWYAGNNSTDNGNNDNWIFNDEETWLSNRPKRDVIGDLLVSWKKDFDATITLFTVGVSIIGGNDIIAPSEQIDSQWNKYKYFDETDYLLDLEWENSLNMPQGGVSVGMAGGSLDNTSGRFTPNYMGGQSELYTAILPRRPFIINAGFEDQGIDVAYPQFVGLFNRQPVVDARRKRLDFSGMDFVNFLQNRYVDDEAMYTGYRSDQLIEQILQSQGFTTAQYDLDTGINRINFAIFKRGDRFGNIINDIVRAEYGQFYQAEDGVLKFDNRQHWDNLAADDYLLLTSQVLEAHAPNDDHIINVVEIKADVRAKQPEQTIFRLATYNSVELASGTTTELFVDFEDPVLSVTTPTSSSTTSFFKANTESDGSGTDVSSSITITRLDKFSNAAKIIFNNATASTAYITELVITGRSAPIQKNIYYRGQDDSSVTAYEQQPLVIENDYIQDETWAESFAQMILNDFGDPENLINVRVRAVPQLMLGDLVSWQGRHWRVFRKSARLNTSEGFIQDLQLLRRETRTYFRIGISTIGGDDLISP